MITYHSPSPTEGHQDNQILPDSAMKQFHSWANDDKNTGFFRLPNLANNIDECKNIIPHYQHLPVLLHVGLGGSSLGPEVIVEALGNKQGSKKTSYFLNNLDSDELHRILQNLNPKDCFCFVVSKSGETLETKALLCTLLDWFHRENCQSHIASNFLFCTGPQQNTVKDISQQLQANWIHLPEELGGRYSVLSPVGIIPLMWLGHDPKDLLTGVQQHLKDFQSQKSYVYPLLNDIVLNYQNHHIQQTVLMPYSSTLKKLSLWFVQLWAESLGKINQAGESVGMTPLFAYGSCDQHSQLQLFIQGPKDKFFVLLNHQSVQNSYQLHNLANISQLDHLKPLNIHQILLAQKSGTFQALADHHRPCCELRFDKINPYNLGYLFHSLQTLTVLMGAFLQVNPFDQPAVEHGKLITKGLLF